MSDELLTTNQYTPPPPITPAQAQAAARTVARHAHNNDDAHQLLTTLGLSPDLLTPTPPTPPHNPHAAAETRYATFRHHLTQAIGAPIPLHRLTDTTLHKAHDRLVRDAIQQRPHAWIHATLLAAEQHRRASYRARAAHDRAQETP